MKNKKIFYCVIFVLFFSLGLSIAFVYGTYLHLQESGNYKHRTQYQESLRQELIKRLSFEEKLNYKLSDHKLVFNEMMADFPMQDYITSFEQELDNVFNQARISLDQKNSGNVKSSSFVIEDTNDKFSVSAIIKNVKKEELKVQIVKPYLEITAQQQGQKNEDSKSSAMAQELEKLNFKKVIKMPSSVDISSAQAKFDNDVLEITFKKLEPKQLKPIIIQVK